MLVLSRKNSQSVVIGVTGDGQELLRVTILDIRGNTVRLGFTADHDVGVYREEVWQRVQAENQALAVTGAQSPK